LASPYLAAPLDSRLLLVGVFLIAAVAKLADPAGSRRAVVGFGVPERLASGSAWVCRRPNWCLGWR
jgi:hypothetical protein